MLRSTHPLLQGPFRSSSKPDAQTTILYLVAWTALGLCWFSRRMRARPPYSHACVAILAVIFGISFAGLELRSLLLPGKWREFLLAGDVIPFVGSLITHTILCPTVTWSLRRNN